MKNGKRRKKDVAESKFELFVKAHVSASDFELIHHHLGVSKKLVTSIFENPENGKRQHLYMIAKLIGKNHPHITETYIMDQFGFGKKGITAPQKALVDN